MKTDGIELSEAREKAIEVIGCFEELLARKGVMIPSVDREGAESEACIYGCEYYELEDEVTEIMEKVMKK